MKETISGKNKIQQICTLLKKETLDPAKQEASEIVENAHMQATAIVDQAKQEAERRIQEAGTAIEKKKQAFESALSLAAKQSIEALKQQIQEQLFNPQLSSLMSKGKAEASLLARLIEVIIKALEKEGIDADLSVAVGQEFDPQKINAELSNKILTSLKEKGVTLGGFAKGITVKIHKNDVTLDFSDSALTELMTQFIRKDFRDFFFEKK